ncbi:hypothetical protein [Nonomuraea gerenzanensis]|nr:hypothetical protein [Nonomuraea gerenzanensis]UBU08846.1 hypothetical protein LCN96_31180 [Nonomuraea gerenzanensis]
MTRAAKIAAIQAQRATSAATAEGMERRLAALAEGLSRLEAIRADLVTRVEDDARDQLSALAEPLKDLMLGVRRERAELERVLARLRRTTLNIGVVGRAGQGKSRLLQSLTGLTTREIPDGSGGFCTGVPSVVRHAPGTTTYADVFFHTEQSFLHEVVTPYFERLRLGRSPTSLEDFAGPLPPLEREGQEDIARKESAYAHLSSFRTTLTEYRRWLGTTSPHRITADQIREFVAQDDPDGNRRYHAFRAVRRVHITTSFPHDDLGGIGTIDLPGLGDTNLGDSRLLLSALSDDVDVVLFVRRPAPERDAIQDTDIDLYDLAQSALPDIPMEKRSFLLLNHRRSLDQDNLNNARLFRDQIPGSAIKVAGTDIVDCSDAEAVATAFEPVVDYLLTHVGELDRMLLRARRQTMAELGRQITLLISQARRLDALAQPASMWFPTFQSLFKQAHTSLSAELDQLVDRLREERGLRDTAFSQSVRAVLALARSDDGIPAPEDIRTRFAVEGTRQAAYSHLLDETRAHLSRHFLGLHDGLRECVGQMHEDVAALLARAGGLAPLSGRQGRLFLLDVAERIPPTLRQGRPSEIQYALTMLTEFELNYRGFVQHRIRPCLDGLHGDSPAMALPSDGTLVDEKTMREMLRISYEEALDRCDTALDGLTTEPNGAVFAIVEEFRDRVLRAEGSTDEWRAFYQDIRAELWSDTFSALAEQAGHLRVWDEAVQALASLLDQGHEEEK